MHEPTTLLNNIRVVLVGPLYGGNVGAACRAMMNMGISDLVIAAPRASLDWDEARKMACHALPVLEHLREFSTLIEAVADCALVAGTSAREGLYRGHCKSPREWAPRLVAAAAAGNRVALVFGPEDNGLSNDDLALCTHIVRIPTADAYASLNVSQAVMVCAYELFLNAGLYETPMEWSPEAPTAMREAMFTKWRKALLAIGFMDEEKADHMMLGLRRIFARAPLTEKDALIMMGIAQQSLWCAGELAKHRSAAHTP